MRAPLKCTTQFLNLGLQVCLIRPRRFWAIFFASAKYHGKPMNHSLIFWNFIPSNHPALLYFFDYTVLISWSGLGFPLRFGHRLWSFRTTIRSRALWPSGTRTPARNNAKMDCIPPQWLKSPFSRILLEFWTDPPRDKGNIFFWLTRQETLTPKNLVCILFWNFIFQFFFMGVEDMEECSRARLVLGVGSHIWLHRRQEKVVKKLNVFFDDVFFYGEAAEFRSREPESSCGFFGSFCRNTGTLLHSSVGFKGSL